MRMTNIPVKFRVDRINEAIAALKPDFDEFIKDKSYSLEERWEVFKNANSELSNHQSWIIDLPTKNNYDFSWYDEFYTERYQTINLVQFVEETLADLEEEAKDSESYQHESKKKLWESLDVNQIKEWILENNIKSFKHDW